VDERDLITRAKEGDRAAMGELYERHSRRVYTVVRRLVGDDHLAEDLSQEAWVRAFEKLHLFRGDSAFGTWIYRLATNVALNRLRRSSKRNAVEAGANLPRVVKAPDDMVVNRKVLTEAMDQLPPGYRRVLVLHDIEGWTHDEIATSLNCSTGTSKSQLHKARARMRDLIAPAAKVVGTNNDGTQDQARL
jgi:RNA polymerase sigma-70 factor (ECF subfamily)